MNLFDKPHRILNKEHQMLNIMSYLNSKDLTNVNRANKKFYMLSSKFNSYWLKSCYEYFCESDLSNDSSLPCKIEQYLSATNDKYSWKTHFGLGIAIKQNYDRIEDLSENTDTEYKIELGSFKEYLYDGLKSFYSLPQLRKEKLYIESHWNSPFQTHLLDFIYDQQDIYIFYANQFQTNKGLTSDQEIKTRQSGLSFESLLKSFDSVLKEFKSFQDRESLWNIRNHKFVFDSSTCASQDFSYEYLTQTRSFSCYQSNHKYLKNYSNDKTYSFLDVERFILSEPISDLDKRFSHSVTELAKSELTIETIKAYQEEFSHNRLLYLIHSLVLTVTHFCRTISSIILLTKNCSEDQLIKEYFNRYNSFIDFSINLNLQLENINVLVNMCSDCLFKNQLTTPKFSLLRVMLIIWNKEVLREMQNAKGQNLIASRITKLFGSIIQSKFASQLTSDEVIIEDIESVEFYLEQAISSLIDVSVNEYSVFTLNHSCFSKSIKDFDIANLLFVSIRQFIKQNCMINAKISNANCDSILNSVDFIKDFIQSFNTFAFIKKGLILSAIAELTQALKNKLNQINGLKNDWIEDYVDSLANYDNSCLNDSDDIKTNAEVMRLLMKLKKWKAEIFEQEFNYIDKQIDKEVKRRNIQLDFSKEVENALSFFPK